MSTETPIATAKANVMLYDQESSTWVPSLPGSGQMISKISLYHNPQTNTYRVVGWRLQDKAVVINCSIPRGLKYHQARNTFHQWRDNKQQVYGLNFINPEEAEKFAAAVQSALDNLAHLHRMQQQQFVESDDLSNGHYLDKSHYDLAPNSSTKMMLNNNNNISDVTVLNGSNNSIRAPVQQQYAPSGAYLNQQQQKQMENHYQASKMYQQPDQQNGYYNQQQENRSVMAPPEPPKAPPPPPVPSAVANGVPKKAPPNPPPPPPPPPAPNSGTTSMTNSGSLPRDASPSPPAENSFEAQLRAAKANKLKSVGGVAVQQQEQPAPSSPAPAGAGMAASGTLNRTQGVDMMSDLQRVLAARRKAREGGDETDLGDASSARRASTANTPTSLPTQLPASYSTLRKNSSALLLGNGPSSPSINGNGTTPPVSVNGTGGGEFVTRADLEAFKRDILREIQQAKKEILEALH